MLGMDLHEMFMNVIWQGMHVFAKYAGLCRTIPGWSF